MKVREIVETLLELDQDIDVIVSPAVTFPISNLKDLDGEPTEFQRVPDLAVSYPIERITTVRSFTEPGHPERVVLAYDTSAYHEIDTGEAH